MTCVLTGSRPRHISMEDDGSSKDAEEAEERLKDQGYVVNDVRSLQPRSKTVAWDEKPTVFRLPKEPKNSSNSGLESVSSSSSHSTRHEEAHIEEHYHDGGAPAGGRRWYEQDPAQPSRAQKSDDDFDGGSESVPSSRPHSNVERSPQALILHPGRRNHWLTPPGLTESQLPGSESNHIPDSLASERTERVRKGDEVYTRSESPEHYTGEYRSQSSHPLPPTTQIDGHHSHEVSSRLSTLTADSYHLSGDIETNGSRHVRSEEGSSHKVGSTTNQASQTPGSTHITSNVTSQSMVIPENEEDDLPRPRSEKENGSGKIASTMSLTAESPGSPQVTESASILPTVDSYEDDHEIGTPSQPEPRNVDEEVSGSVPAPLSKHESLREQTSAQEPSQHQPESGSIAGAHEPNKVNQGGLTSTPNQAPSVPLTKETEKPQDSSNSEQTPNNGVNAIDPSKLDLKDFIKGEVHAALNKTEDEINAKVNEKIDQEMRDRLTKSGFTPNQINALIDPTKAPQASPPPQRNSVKVSRDLLSVDTLIYYDIPYELDSEDPKYLIILRDMDKKEMDILFEHTKRLRQRSDRRSRVVIEEKREKTSKGDYVFVSRKPKRVSTSAEPRYETFRYVESSRSRSRDRRRSRRGRSISSRRRRRKEYETHDTAAPPEPRELNANLRVPPFLAWPTEVADKHGQSTYRHSDDALSWFNDQSGVSTQRILEAIERHMYKRKKDSDVLPIGIYHPFMKAYKLGKAFDGISENTLQELESAAQSNNGTREPPNGSVSTEQSQAGLFRRVTQWQSQKLRTGQASLVSDVKNLIDKV